MFVGAGSNQEGAAADRANRAVPVSSEVFVPTSIRIGVAYPTPVMSIVLVVGVLGAAPTPVGISVASNAHTMVAIQIATLVNASHQGGSGSSGVMRGRITR